MRRRLLISAASLALAWLAVEIWFEYQGPEARRTSDGAKLLPSFEASDEQLERWGKRLTRLRKLASGEATRKTPRLVVFSERYGWTNAEGVEGDLNGDHVVLNSIGARGAREIGEAPPDCALRVACYGESFTFGTEVDEGEDWPAQLGTAAGDALEVVNMGVMGWGTDQALLRFRDTRSELDPDVVLIALMSENIQRNVNRMVSVRAPGEHAPLVKPRFLLEDGALQLLPQPYASELEVYEAVLSGDIGYDLAPHEWLAQSSAGESWSSVADAMRMRRERAQRAKWWLQWQQPTGEPFQVTLALLEAFHREARETGARFAGVVILYARNDISDPARQLTRLHEALDQREVPYLDLYDLIRDRQARGEPAYGATHLTADANGEVADAVHAWLADELDL